MKLYFPKHLFQNEGRIATGKLTFPRQQIGNPSWIRLVVNSINFSSMSALIMDARKKFLPAICNRKLQNIRFRIHKIHIHKFYAKQVAHCVI